MSLKTYVPDWLGFDRGREGVLVGPLWKGVLDILAKHEGEDYYNYESPLYEELEQEFPEESWIGDNEDRQFFRAYSAAWTLTGVVEKRNGARSHHARARPGVERHSDQSQHAARVCSGRSDSHSAAGPTGGAGEFT